MPVTINGNGSLTGLSVGGLPDGIVDTDVLANNAVTSAKSTLTEGITMADQWRLSDHVDLGTSEADITTLWERNDSTGYEKIGTGMSQSSGIFTFPQTGIYWVNLFATTYGSGGATNVITARIKTRKNGGSYADRAQGSDQAYTTNAYGCINMSILFDVEDVSGDNVKLAALAGASSRKLLGSSTVQRTGFTFIRVGNT